MQYSEVSGTSDQVNMSYVWDCVFWAILGHFGTLFLTKNIFFVFFVILCEFLRLFRPFLIIFLFLTKKWPFLAPKIFFGPKNIFLIFFVFFVILCEFLRLFRPFLIIFLFLTIFWSIFWAILGTFSPIWAQTRFFLCRILEDH